MTEERARQIVEPYRGKTLLDHDKVYLITEYDVITLLMEHGKKSITEEDVKPLRLHTNCHCLTCNAARYVPIGGDGCSCVSIPKVLHDRDDVLAGVKKLVENKLDWLNKASGTVAEGMRTAYLSIRDKIIELEKRKL